MSVRLSYFEANLGREPVYTADYLRFDRRARCWEPTMESEAEAVACQNGAPYTLIRAMRVRPIERFWAYTYIEHQGVDAWREYTRQALLDELVIVALRRYFLPLQLERKRGRVYGDGASLVVDPGFKLAEMVKRIAAAGSITPSEFEAIKHEWRAWWAKHGPSVRLARTTDAVHADAILSAVGAPISRD